MNHPTRLWTVLLLCFSAALPAAAAEGHPAVTDPPPLDPPPSMEAVRIPSGGVELNGIIYLPGGEAPHPVAFVLHGLPGDERNLDLAHALRRAGWAVGFFHYRGAFGFDHVLEDVSAAVDWSLGPEVRERFGLDTAPRALVGHSMGGFAALVGGAVDEDVGCIASLAGADMSRFGRALASDPELADQVVESFDFYARGPLAGTTGRLMVAELKEGVERFDVIARADDLAERRLLLVGGERDQVVAMADHHVPLLQALRERDSDVTEVVLDDDHAFSGSRIALARALGNWLGEDCRP